MRQIVDTIRNSKIKSNLIKMDFFDEFAGKMMQNCKIRVIKE